MNRTARLLSLLLSSFLAACVAGTPETPARGQGAPPPLPEVKTAPPAPGMLWIPGAWHDDGVQYVWIPGRWESPRPATQNPDG
ncbi:YXWGXW repeat-containing protein [Polyangium fumosum]|uniref:Uncharacterized protein n=1 Tax=Polyangium fumosum TaxID=889272 RepID=A0A4U1JJU1_9BACT|nr:YXWGXW repeat-containing protein [Polyangium fumosum]TKD13031.1 hypothetical protein E8A74_00280 [Polyangium fumosum]